MFILTQEEELKNLIKHSVEDIYKSITDQSPKSKVIKTKIEVNVMKKQRNLKRISKAKDWFFEKVYKKLHNPMVKLVMKNVHFRVIEYTFMQIE